MLGQISSEADALNLPENTITLKSSNARFLAKGIEEFYPEIKDAPIFSFSIMGGSATLFYLPKSQKIIVPPGGIAIAQDFRNNGVTQNIQKKLETIAAGL